MIPIDETNIPRYAMYRGKKVRIVGYNSDSVRQFDIIDSSDHNRSVARSELTFIKARKAK